MVTSTATIVDQAAGDLHFAWEVRADMARGMKCRECGYQMYAMDERHEPQGTWVTYVCRNSSCGWREKVFESK